MRADAAPSVFDGPLGGFAHSVFELGEDLLDRIEIGAVGRQEEHPRADRARLLAFKQIGYGP